MTMNDASAITGNHATFRGGGIWTFRCRDLHGAVAGTNVRGNTAPTGPNIYSFYRPHTC